MGAGCSSSKNSGLSQPTDKTPGVAAAPDPRPGHVYLSYHPADTGDQRAEGGDGAAGRVRDWLISRGYIVVLGEPDPDANVTAAAAASKAAGSGDNMLAGGAVLEPVRGRRVAAGVQSGLELSWQARMQQCVEQCQAFVALVSEHYGSRSEAAREIHAVDSLAAGATTLIPLWHSGTWPPTHPSLEPVLTPLQRVPRGPRPLCRTILEGVMGELLEQLQAVGCMPAPKVPTSLQAPTVTASTAAGSGGDGNGGGSGGGGLDAARGVEAAASLDWCFQPGPSDPPEADYVVVRCYTGKLQELSDRISMAVRPTVFDLGGDTFSGDLPLLELKQHQKFLTAPDASAPATGGTLLIDRPHITLRNGALLLRQDQELRVLGPGVLLDTMSVITEPKQSGPRGIALGPGGGAAGVGGGGGRVIGAPYESGRALVVLAGAIGVRMLKCQVTNLGPHLTLWLADGATVALRDCQLEAPEGGGAWVRDAGSTLVAQATRLQRCAGPCLQLEAGGSAQLASCSVVDSAQHNGVLVGSGSRLRADQCVLSGSQAGINLYGGASAELVGCEVVSNFLAGAEVSEQGSNLVAVSCKFSMNGQSGVLVAGGASASLTSCTCTGNKAHGVLVRGPGSVGALRQMILSHNGQAGALLNDGARTEMAACEATGNKVAGLVAWGSGTRASAADCSLTQNAGGGFALRDGAVVEMTSCLVKNNRMPSEVAGRGSVLRLLKAAAASKIGPGGACVIDPAPRLLEGGVVSDMRADKGAKASCSGKK